MNPIKIKIPKPDPYDECDADCPLLDVDSGICRGGGQRAEAEAPGPICKPGVHELAPEGTMEKIR